MLSSLNHALKRRKSNDFKTYNTRMHHYKKKRGSLYCMGNKKLRKCVGPSLHISADRYTSFATSAN